MLIDLARALPAALAAVVAPGYFWARFLRPADGLAERLAYAVNVTAFENAPGRYRKVFSDRSVVIYAPARLPCPGSGG